MRDAANREPLRGKDKLKIMKGEVKARLAVRRASGSYSR
jgi:hypothetical protein